MGLLDQIGGMLGNSGGGGAPDLGALFGGRDRMDDDDHQQFGHMMQNASHDDINHAFTHAAQNVDDREYDDHITPGVNGTDPLGGVGQGGLSSIASTLMSHLGGSGGGGMSQMANMIPGLRNSDPSRMDQHDVASLLNWTRRNRPDAFGAAAAQLGRQQPGLLNHLMGNKGLMLAAGALAMKYFASRRR